MKKITILLLVLLCLPILQAAYIQWNDTTRGTSNFHCYEIVTGTSLTWAQAKAAAAARWVVIGGTTYYGHLVTITYAAENEFIRTSFDLGTSPWIGAYQYDNLAEPTGHWAWVTGETFSYTNWSSGEPNNVNGGEDVAQIYTNGLWNDLPVTSTLSGYLVEYDAISVIPEPGTFFLLGMACIALFLRIKK